MGLTSAFSKPGGGGRLNNVDGVIQDFQFSTEFPYAAKDGAKRKGNKPAYPSLWLNLTVLADGAEEATIEPLFAGNNEQWTIADDGHSISPNPDSDDTPRLFGNAPRFLQSAFDKGFAEPEYEEGEDIDLTPLIDERFRFIQVVDEAANAKKGKRKDKKDPTKTYDNKTLEVSEYYGPAEAVPAKGKKVAGKPAVAAKGGKKAAPVEEDFTEEATAVLVAILKANDGEINKSKVGMASLKMLLKTKSASNKDDFSAFIRSDDFLETEDGWSYNKKTGVISVA